MLGAQSMVPAHLRTVVSVPEIASFIQSSFQLSFECGLRWSHTIALDGLYWTWGIIYALTKKNAAHGALDDIREDTWQTSDTEQTIGLGERE